MIHDLIQEGNHESYLYSVIDDNSTALFVNEYGVCASFGACCVINNVVRVPISNLIVINMSKFNMKIILLV